MMRILGIIIKTFAVIAASFIGILSIILGIKVIAITSVLIILVLFMGII